jgi:hypothetical protein
MTVKLLRRETPETSASAPASQPDSELLAQRDRLTERFALLQSELGGLFYEMAIRDSIQMDILIAKAADLQRLDGELGAVEHLLEGGARAVGGQCPKCGSVYAPGASFCGQCAHPLTAAAG